MVTTPFRSPTDDFSSECWGEQGPHKPAKRARDGMPHEKTDPAIVDCLRGALDTSRTREALGRAIRDDATNKWFAVRINVLRKGYLLEYGRYTALMRDWERRQPGATRHPQMVSFIGPTNAGKSALIKMLIELKTNPRVTAGSAFPAPVVGSTANDALPTSGDAHLFADPATYDTTVPVLYVDCEGFEGGEGLPLGSSTWALAQEQPGGQARLELPESTVRPLVTEYAGREEVVTTFYPRILYTISDCVVFVLRNPKSFQSAVLSKLIEWGAAAFEQSLNQPSLPHCIVVLNACDPNIDPHLWNADAATADLLRTIEDAVRDTHTPRFQERKAFWLAHGVVVSSVAQLIALYYSSFTVIRVPAGPRYTSICTQVLKLYQRIQDACIQSYTVKSTANVAPNAIELNRILIHAFEHFATSPDRPFDFGQVSSEQIPISQDFGTHILRLCALVTAQQARINAAWVRHLFDELSPVLASCMVLDSTRSRRLRRDQLFIDHEACLRQVLLAYVHDHYPCSYVNDRERRCITTQAAHKKRHRDEKGMMTPGEYQRDLPDLWPTWKAQLQDDIKCYSAELKLSLRERRHDSAHFEHVEKRAIAENHARVLVKFWNRYGPAENVISSLTCLCCLFNPDRPEQPLPCGHFICNPCSVTFGRPDEKSIIIPNCPLHGKKSVWARPVTVRQLPAQCGRRMLALDDGMALGIVQLECLRVITEMAQGIPLFDLVVGTGTGGVIGLMLSRKSTSIDECIESWIRFCKRVYVPRTDDATLLSHGLRLVTKGIGPRESRLYEALQQMLTPDDVLFEPRFDSRKHCDVAVMTSSSHDRTSLLASYRRPQDAATSYDLDCPGEPTHRLKTWEAAAAAMSLKPHFEAFRAYNRVYQSAPDQMGPHTVALHEAALIWPESMGTRFLMSIGTGRHIPLTTEPTHSRSLKSRVGSVVSGWRKSAGENEAPPRAEWATFEAETEAHASVMRLNPVFSSVLPAKDNGESIRGFYESVKMTLREFSNLEQMKSATRNLVALSFYQCTSQETNGTVKVHIRCRFAEVSERQALGKYLRKHFAERSSPYFNVIVGDGTSEMVPITFDDASGMAECGEDKVWEFGVNAARAHPLTILLNLYRQEYHIDGSRRHILTSPAPVW